ncbi:MAG: phosphatidate cytidylyltransferase [Peptoniphilaceae bacterium]|nr:phosphatidate cytidylyltransferase [Peptoniphilaceae bacterium]MDY5766266.1 phosphatidate cytidylyltransferase [Peptoniphilaceae bacterium]
MIAFLSRTIVGILIVVTNLGIVLLGSRFLLFLFIVFLSTLAVWELAKGLRIHRRRDYAELMLVNFLILLSVYFTRSLTIAVILLLIPMMSMVVRATRNAEQETTDFLASVFIHIYISIFFSFALLYEKSEQHLILFTFSVAWGTDTFAYLVGMLMGKHKLTAISPKKTVEGSIGGIIGSIILCLIFRMLFYPSAKILGIVLFGAAGSVVAQIGDLFASKIKRDANIKDFSHVLREHGGILDRYDSVLFALPFLWLFFHLPWFS